MNILRMVYDFPPSWWGLAPGTYELSKAQIELGNKITVFAGEWPRQKNYREDELVVKRFPRCFPYIGGFFTYSPTSLLRYLMVRRRFDLIHAHNYHPFWYYLYKKLIKDKILLILHMHMTSAQRAYTHQNVGFLTKNIEWRFSIVGEKIGCQLADAIICVSESVRDEVLKWYKADPEKVFVIPNGVNIELFTPFGSNLREGLGLGDSKVILFVGRLNKNKNVDLLIESLRYLPDDYKLLVIGEGQDKKELIELTYKLKLQKRIIFTGFIPYPELANYYRTADIFALLSTLEGFPKVVLEALASGVPVITSKSFRADKFLSEHIFQIDDIHPEKFAEKIQEIIREGHKVNVEEIKKNYDWTIIAKKIQKIYEK